MKESSEVQEELYKNYWYKIEKYTDFNVSSFLRDYLTMRERRIPRTDRVYTTFKDYIHKQYTKSQEVLSELLQFSEYYHAIIQSSDSDTSITKILARINKLETIVAYPFLLEVYDARKQGIIDNE